MIKWNKVYFAGRRVTIYGIILCCVFSLFNVYFTLNNGYIKLDSNYTETVACQENPNGWFVINFWSWVFNY